MSRQPPLSVVVTTLNNAATLEDCLASVTGCEDLVVLDSGSSDATEDIARKHDARFEQRAFAGYGPHKQAAIDLAANDWVLLLDADERLAAGSLERIRAAITRADVAGFRLPRREWLFWRWPHPRTRPNWQLRLFDRRRVRMNDVPVHAAPAPLSPADRIAALDAAFLHYGEPELAVRVDKINRYSSGLLAKPKPLRFIALRLLLYPSFSFWRMYLGKRYFLNGWAGLIAARTHGYYAFLKYAKRLEAARKATTGASDGDR